jgi:tetratricopeptide (TPR) repeat protein
MGNPDLAIEYHKKDLEFDPDDDGARRDLALLYHRLGRKEEALKEYKILKKENSVLVPGLKPIFEPAQ